MKENKKRERGLKRTENRFLKMGERKKKEKKKHTRKKKKSKKTAERR